MCCYLLLLYQRNQLLYNLLYRFIWASPYVHGRDNFRRCFLGLCRWRRNSLVGILLCFRGLWSKSLIGISITGGWVRDLLHCGLRCSRECIHRYRWCSSCCSNYTSYLRVACRVDTSTVSTSYSKQIHWDSHRIYHYSRPLNYKVPVCNRISKFLWKNSNSNYLRNSIDKDWHGWVMHFRFICSWWHIYVW